MRNKFLTLLLLSFCLYLSCKIYSREPGEITKIPNILKNLPDTLLVLPDSGDNVKLLIFKKAGSPFASRKFILYASGELDISLSGLDPKIYPFRFLKRSEIDKIIKKLNDWGYFGLTEDLLFDKFFVKKFGCISPKGSCCFNSPGPKIHMYFPDYYESANYQCIFQFVNFKHEMNYSPSEFSGFDDFREIIILDSCMAYLENALQVID
jgi:hypothetical protein